MADRLDDELSRSMRSEIEMEGATITGGMPTFEFLNKAANKHYLRTGTASAEVFTLPNGQKIALVPEDQAAAFLGSGGVTGLEENIHGRDVAVDYRKVMNPEAADRVVAARDMYERLMSGNAPRTPENVALGAQRRRILGSTSGGTLVARGMNRDEYEAVKRYAEGQTQVGYEDWKNRNYRQHVEDKQLSFPTLDIGNGFHLVLGAEQEYQDKESFGTYEMTDDGQVLHDPGKSIQSIPIVFYSDPNVVADPGTRGPGMLSTKVPEASHLRDQGVHIDRSVPLTARDNVTPSGTAHFHDIRLIPPFTGDDIIEGYKTAKEGFAKKKSPVLPPPTKLTKPPAPIEPAPAPEPRPDPPSSFDWFEAKPGTAPSTWERFPEGQRRFSSNRDLSDDLLVDSYKMRGE